uniref:Peptidase M10 metallopeptidase domain-containing protein n=1 Tax=Ditylum brightwellii TaxID=49249 RepID=A0A7S4VY47_9STRA
MGSSKSSAVKWFRIALMTGILGFGGYTAWRFLGEPDVDELIDIITNFTNSTFGGVSFPDFPDIDFPDDWDFGDFGDVLDNLTDFVDEWINDPYVGNNATYYWKSEGKAGLSLQLLNALDDTWQDEYDAAVLDWEEGTPDALTLTTKKVEVDNECTQVEGVMKVCNGNYGETGWLGINELLLVGDGQIHSSVAKMNEWYLMNADIYERQYTMCHEIGHGFGLAHTDENFYNKDLGNCMDYTDSPENNLHPDTGNYNTLMSLYGVVGNTRYLQGRSLALNPERLSPRLRHSYETAINEFIEASKQIEEAEYAGKWRLLRKHAGGAKYGTKLPDGYTLEVTVLSVLNGSK